MAKWAFLSVFDCGFKKTGIDEGVVALLNQPLEETVKDGPGNATDGSSGLVAGLTLGHPLGSDLDPWLAEVLDHQLCVNLEENSQSTTEKKNIIGVLRHLERMGHLTRERVWA